ncbi:MAG: hypothetical protein AABY07_07830 [Nanoarchaeota archaeon]
MSKRFMTAGGIISSLFGILIGLNAAVTSNYILLGICGVFIIVGVLLLILSFD